MDGLLLNRTGKGGRPKAQANDVIGRATLLGRPDVGSEGTFTAADGEGLEKEKKKKKAFEICCRSVGSFWMPDSALRQ